ncbi:hypothetical protein HYH03_001611 [Edaphochlamys debaryana]|uniref:Methyltransferase domain-containing protein n=1 Tax=Edaphochlamys debaryana TaxID=47281 RepID=A0A835YDF4_9CHLO|nr:hypothetical protein HYH03_001611 [Edaphochlamys debaryana]|eukprot:KAG2500850.1 hypothetical protein HYH03_001611 [Edaphochlamys debaryana]
MTAKARVALGLLLATLAVASAQYTRHLASDVAHGRRIPSRWPIGSSVLASHHLSRWRSSIFVRVNEFLQAWGNDQHPRGHHLFGPYAPCVDCPAEAPKADLTPSSTHLEGTSTVCDLRGLPAGGALCTVLSVAANNSARFERAVLDASGCDVVTLDCTQPPPKPLDAKRHRVLPYCIGSTDPDKRLRSYAHMLELAAAAGFGGPGSQRLPLLRLAVDAWEYAALAQWREDTPGLPEQVIVQLHTRANAGPEAPDQRWGRFEYGVSDMALFFMHMATLGYAPLSRWNLAPTAHITNAPRGGFTEYSFLRVELPAPPADGSTGASRLRLRRAARALAAESAAAPAAPTAGAPHGPLPIRVLLGNDGWHVQADRNLSDWRSSLFLRANEFLQQWRNDELPYGHHRFDLLAPYVECPPDRPLRLLGNGKDGSKLVCGVLEPEDKGLCTILSFGSNNNVRFERAVLEATPCRVATFDCTVADPTIVDEQRHSFHKLCVGSSEHAAAKPDTIKTYSQILELLNISRCPLLKIDVEAYEYPLFGEWAEDTPGLPEQIAVEIHGRALYSVERSALPPRWGRHEYGVTDLALFWAHLANLGYATTAQAVTEEHGELSEFTFMRVEAHAGHALPHRAGPAGALGLRARRARQKRQGPQAAQHVGTQGGAVSVKALEEAAGAGGRLAAATGSG